MPDVVFYFFELKFLNFQFHGSITDPGSCKIIKMYLVVIWLSTSLIHLISAHFVQSQARTRAAELPSRCLELGQVDDHGLRDEFNERNMRRWGTQCGGLSP